MFSLAFFFFFFIIISIPPSCRQDGADGARSSGKAGRPLPVSRLLLVLLVLVEEDLVLVQLVEEDRHGQRLPDAVRGEGWRRSRRLEALRRVGQLRGQAVQVGVLDSFRSTRVLRLRREDITGKRIAKEHFAILCLPRAPATPRRLPPP